MAAADLRAELSCSICTSIYTDPVSLPCSHNFCRDCIGTTWDTQVETFLENPSCPECRKRFKRRPELTTDWKLRDLVERFRPTETEPGETGIFCTYCVLSPVPAAKSCLLCEASLCDTHLRGHSKSAEHVLTQPTDSFMGRKCSVHHKVLEYYCCEESGCICVYCWVSEEHRGHRVELLSEASEKKKEKLRPEREKTKRGAQRPQERRREVAEKAAVETKKVTGLAGIVTGVKGRWIYGQEATDLLLDINMAGNFINVLGDRKSASFSCKDQGYPYTPERFSWPQTLSSRSFPSGRHYWEVEVSESGSWRVGVAYPSIERRGGEQIWIGDNNKSWCLCRWANLYSVRHDKTDKELLSLHSCRRIRISLDYEAGTSVLL
ncbi:hypothetical protein XELAEV_18008588mg [Xenopus laevis]|uniref:Uncharacterized protein n=1 Tax=Xenopus laevis TaxID=8355 RepID=A0A974E3W3_XENLA|nr:hypothetical protein XELAEV_18008588mg [Xenopus laevis]